MHCHAPFWRADPGSWDVTGTHWGFMPIFWEWAETPPLKRGWENSKHAGVQPWVLHTDCPVLTAFQRVPRVFFMLAGLQKFGKEEQ